jgi:hypothetical protein
VNFTAMLAMCVWVSECVSKWVSEWVSDEWVVSRGVSVCVSEWECVCGITEIGEDWFDKIDKKKYTRVLVVEWVSEWVSEWVKERKKDSETPKFRGIYHSERLTFRHWFTLIYTPLVSRHPSTNRPIYLSPLGTSYHQLQAWRLKNFFNTLLIWGEYRVIEMRIFRCRCGVKSLVWVSKGAVTPVVVRRKGW